MLYITFMIGGTIDKKLIQLLIKKEKQIMIPECGRARSYGMIVTHYGDDIEIQFFNTWY